MKPFSPASQRNQEPILAVLREAFADRRAVLEIGSGTGQHAVHFAAALPDVTWQTSDRAENLDGIAQWLDEARLPNTPAALAFDVDGPWPVGVYDAIYTANTLHIMSWAQVERLFTGLPSLLARDAVLVAYGPFNDDGRFSSPSNEAFDASLRARDPLMGIRDVAAVDALARSAGLRLVAGHDMPANNRCLVWNTAAR
jgi:cyclopropane fatty-acyl-phospholipid synthase-like methyltransferase